jgi:hypothetical protein
MINNRKLGNGFVIKSAGSVNNQEHFFAGQKKNIALRLHFSQSLSVSSGNSVEPNWTVEDAQAYAVDTGSFGSIAFGFNDVGIPVHNPRLKLYMNVFTTPGDTHSPDVNDFQIEVQDKHSSYWETYQTVRSIAPPALQSDGFYEMLYDLEFADVGKKMQMAFNGAAVNKFLKITELGIGTYERFSVRDAVLEFEVPLTDSGAYFYDSLDNQNIRLFNINRDMAKEVKNREVSYYNWKSNSVHIGDVGFTGIAVDSVGRVFVCAAIDLLGGQRVWTTFRLNQDGTYVCVDYHNPHSSINRPQGIAISPVDDSIYVCGYENTADPPNVLSFVVRRSFTGLSGSFETVDCVDRDGGGAYATCIAIDSVGVVYVGGVEIVAGESANWIIRRSADGSSGSFATVDHWDLGGRSDYASFVVVDSHNAVYVGGYSQKFTPDLGNSTYWIVRTSANGLSGTFSEIDRLSLADPAYTYGTINSANAAAISQDDSLYFAGQLGTKYANVRVGKLTSNSASLGPKVFATSVNKVRVNNLVEQSYYELNNVSEFPHSEGLFQMRNVALGTTSTGKIGSSEDSLIQVRYFGSVVKVMWPKQSDQNLFVKGYGDLAAGQRSGKLTTAFEPGEFVEVTEYDHLSLYCYLNKQASGTLDNIDLRIERRPLRSTGFATEQTVEYSISGSESIATLRDLTYRKEVDYGDLTIKEIAYSIDIPLENVKDIRISAKQVTGQSNVENTNFIIWGRLIKSEEET